MSTNLTLEEKVILLEEQLAQAKRKALTKSDECEQLKKLLSSVDGEVHELTEKVFQEAYKMVNTAEERREKAEKRETEARLKVEVLEEEVKALKAIVKTPKRSIAHRLLNGTNESCGIFSRKLSMSPTVTPPSKNSVFVISQDAREVDPIAHREFVNWRENSLGMDEGSAFIDRSIREDISPCLSFENAELSLQIFSAIKKNSLEMELWNEDKSKLNECSLTKIARYCPYRVRLNPESEWFFVSLLARNRIAAICDFFTYLRYLHQGILKTGIRESYWEIVNLKKNLTLARMGLEFSPKTYNQDNTP